MSEEPCIHIFSMRFENWEAIEKALKIAIEHYDDAIEAIKRDENSTLKDRIFLRELNTQREFARSALLRVLDDRLT